MGRAFEYRRAAKEKRWDKMSKLFPRLGKASGFSRGGSGRGLGREAGSKVGLNKQVSGKSSLRLSGS